LKIDEIAGADVDGADAEAHRAGIDAIEVNEPLERAAQRGRVIPAGRLDRSRWRKIRWNNSRLEEPGSTLEDGGSGAQPIEENVAEIAA
jgi:hypothetical protein